MDSVLRSAFLYLFLMVIFRFTFRRTMAQTSTFEFVLLIMIGEATEGALVGENHSLINSVVVITTLLSLNTLFLALQHRSQQVRRLVDGAPIVILDNGRLLKDRMQRSTIDEQDILTAAREVHGIERLDQIKYAVLETSGTITIVPRYEAQERSQAA